MPEAAASALPVVACRLVAFSSPGAASETTSCSSSALAVPSTRMPRCGMARPVPKILEVDIAYPDDWSA